MIIAGTGHRPHKLGGFDKPNSALIVVITKFLVKTKPEKVISGMALGFDQALAAATINLNIPLIAAIPFENQEKLWPDNEKKYYAYLLNKASLIHMVSIGQFSSEKLQKRNEWMVDNADLILACWNGSSGGTQNCINYANMKRKTVSNCWDDFAVAEGVRRFRKGEKYGVSSGIAAEEITYGYGYLDDYGYWQFPIPASLIEEKKQE